MAFQLNNRNNGFVSKKKASTAYNIGDLLSVDANGFLVPGGAGKIVGISNEQITSASADYASTRDLNYSAPMPNEEFVFPVITGTATQTLVGEYVDVSASDARGVDVTASTNDQVFITRVIDAATVYGLIVQAS